jgi:CheY-like chemotaxis protein
MTNFNHKQSPSRPGFTATRAFKILLVDDAISVRLHVRQILVKSGVALIEASNGLEALRECNKNRDIDLIICDVNMPQMDGFTFLAELEKIWPATAAKPKVVMLTTENHPTIVDKGAQLGVIGWMVKPPPEQALLKFIEKLKNGSNS